MADFKPIEGAIRMSETPPQGVVARIYGTTGSGRSRLAYTAPGPICVLSFNENVEGSASKEVARCKERGYDKIIDVVRIPNPLERLSIESLFAEADIHTEKVKTATRESLLYFGRCWIEALDKYRTVVIETDKCLWDMIQYLWFGTLKPAASTDSSFKYTAPSEKFSHLMGLARGLKGDFGANRNVIFVGKMRAKWANNKKTGEWDLAGKDDVTTFSSVVLETRYDKEVAKMNVGQDLPDNPFSVRVEKSYLTAEETNETVFDGDEAYWPEIMSKLSGTDISIWE